MSKEIKGKEGCEGSPAPANEETAAERAARILKSIEERTKNGGPIAKKLAIIRNRKTK
jgi:tagatose-1,6-bisphosphate aldolase non-catalytic subunit AgaZ/GatZ